MFNSIQPGVLDENVEAVEESARSRAPVGIGLGSDGNIHSLEIKRLRCKRMPESDLVHDYGSNWPKALAAEHAEGAEKGAK